MSDPRRVQLRRTKGWRKPANTVVVSRPSKWGNPYLVIHYSMPKPDALDAAARDFEMALYAGHLDYTIEDVRRELRGKNLACWCPLDGACHADVLLKYANDDELEEVSRDQLFSTVTT